VRVFVNVDRQPAEIVTVWIIDDPSGNPIELFQPRG
jgi:hypothetical protein